MRKFLNFGKSKTDNIAIFIVMLSFVIGFSTIFFKQPMSWYDEETHYSRVIQISNGDFKVIKNNNLSQVGGDISKSENNFITKAWNSKIARSKYPAVDLFWWDRYPEISYSSKKVFRASTNTIPNNPIVYSPYVLVAKMSKGLHLSPPVEFFLMRLSGFICFFLIYLLAIRKAKKGKLFLSLLLFAPTVFLTFASITADAYLIAISALFFVYIFEFFVKIRQKEKIVEKDVLELSIVTLLFSISKLPNFLFVGLLVPVVYLMLTYKSIKKKYAFQLLFTIILAAIIVILWYFYVKDVNTGLFWGRNVDTGKQIHYILKDVMKFVVLLINTVLSFNYFDLQTGYGNIPYYNIPMIICIVYFIGLYQSSRLNLGEESYSFSLSENKANRIFNFFGFLISFVFILLVFVMLYLQFSPVGSNIIDGVQSRYFIPVWLFVLLYFAYNTSSKSYKINNILVACTLPNLMYCYYLVLAYMVRIFY